MNEFIPTWQIGREQERPNDFGRFADEGYRNSIIYPCIQERATSYADLPFRIMPRQGDLIEEHPLIDLLDFPNGEMDGYEFKETLVTHQDIAGNVYVEKVRKSKDRGRQGLPVQELGLLRPDYIEIRPGATRDKDEFVVKIGGQIRRVIPRRDIIHIRLPNPANDFYGLSPVAVIAEHADTDKFMTQFDLAFFKNAGVPMGLLKTKSRHNADEIQEIKSGFRKAYSGFKRWFEVLVLNSEEAEYMPLGGLPKELEMHNTRAQMEARVCAVYGVPPVIVGFQVGIENSPWSNYEQAQFSFYSETMVPMARRISSALTRELLPEFATSALRGARLESDFGSVKALQEDTTERNKAAGELVKSGGWTVNQALGAVGLPELDGGDFYVRALTQVIDVSLPTASRQRIDAIETQPTRLVPTGEGEASTTISAARKQAADPPRARGRLQERAERDLTDFFQEQGRRVAGRLPKSAHGATSFKQDAGDLLPDSEIDLLAEVLRPHYVAGAELGWEEASALLGLPADFPATDPAVAQLLAGAGERIKDITEETLSQIRTALDVARGEGLSIQQTAEMLRDLPAFNAARAERVARTELAIADNRGAATRYRESGLVDEVEIIDGPQCGWTAHNDGDLAHGTRRSLEEFEDQPVSHPNCVRSAAPVIRSES